MPSRIAIVSRSSPISAWLVESVLAIVVVLLLLPAFMRLADTGAGRDQRFAEQAIAVGDLPPAVLPRLCADFGSDAEPALRGRLCNRATLGAAARPPAQLPAPLATAVAAVRQSLYEPIQQAQGRLAELRLQQRDGQADVLALANDIAALEADIGPYMGRYALDAGGQLGPLPLVCASARVEAVLAAPAVTAAQRAGAALLLGAALDGRRGLEALAAAATLPGVAASSAAQRGCAGATLAVWLGRSAALIAEARQSPTNERKSEAMRALLRSAGWQWASWMLFGLALLQLARRGAAPAAGIALAWVGWSALAWLGRVPWPLAGREFEPARVDATLWSAPAGFAIALIAAGALLFAFAWRRRAVQPAAAQTLASRIGYPGLALATGVGWLLLLDLSANAHPGNRYLGLYHQGHLWLGMLLLSTLVFLRQPLGRGLGWTLAVVDELAARVGERFGRWGRTAAGALVGLLLVAIVGTLLANTRQLTSEIGRIWLVVGAAWFFFLRGGPLAERMAQSGNGAASLARYIAPLAFVAAVLVGAMLATRDMGPLLIAGYGAGAFLAASVAMWLDRRSGARRIASVLAVLLFGVWIAAITLALFEVGSLDEVTQGRLESLAAPLASANDQLALVGWFQRAAPWDGFGIGAVPWCGYSPAGGCGGVPAQIHSDYTFSALVGAFGWSAAWALTLFCSFWLHRLIRHHGRVTRGEPRLVASAGGVGNDDQALLSWIAISWVVLTLCQLAVTVAGNLAVLPLTGVTFPFVSFGMTSLVVNMGFLGLCLNLSLPAANSRDNDG